jgi:hypothetical protein
MAAPLSPALIERLTQINLARLAAAQGEKEAIYAAACEELQVSRATLFRYLDQVAVKPPRKRRADAGDSAFTQAEARILSAYLMEHIRKNDKRIKRIDQAVEELRAAGQIVAGRVDAATGEINYLSASAISRALYRYNLHPEQLTAPDPVTPQKSPHPNWCWQVDASLCVLYKLPAEGRRQIEAIPSHEYYKNKLGKLARIEHLLVQRYLITDHASGCLFVYYDLGGESAENLCNLLIAAVRERKGFPFHGAPRYLMADRGSANRSAMFRNLCAALGIELIYAQGARAKGQVEGAHNLWECYFESGLKLAPEVATVEELNRLGLICMHYFNSTEPHSRHKMTRYAAWQLIPEEKVRPVRLTEKELRVLAREKPLSRPVEPYLIVNYKGRAWDVSTVPDVMVGQKLDICRSAYDPDTAHVVLRDEDGHEVFHVVREKRREGDFQFFADGATVGVEHKRHADTPAQRAKKDHELLVTGTETLQDAAAARKAKVVPFGGAIDPYKQAREYQPPAWLPKQGTPVDVPRPQVDLPRLNFTDFLARLSTHMGRDWTPEFYPSVREWYPEGAPETEIPVAAERLRRKEEHRGRVPLTVVK